MASEIAPYRYAVEVTWLTMGDDRVRSAHARLQGVTAVGGPYGRRPTWDMDGYSAHYPGDPMLPPSLRVNCRCWVDVSDPPDPEGWVRVGRPISVVRVTEEGEIVMAGDEEPPDVTLLAAGVGVTSPEDRDPEAEMGKHVEDDNAGCDGFAVVDDDTGEVVSCHETMADAEAAISGGAPSSSSDGVAADLSERPFEWEGALIVEGVPTGDGRMIGEGALTFRDLPLPLMLQTTNPESGGHAGAVLCGSIVELERDGNAIIGRGYFDSGTVGQEAKRLLTEGTLRGVSADLDSTEVEFRDPTDPSKMYDDEMLMEAMLFGTGPEPLMLLTAGRLMGATLTPFPAMQEASLQVIEDAELVASGTPAGRGLRWSMPWGVEAAASLVASAKVVSLVADIPLAPPTGWFERLELEGPTAWHVGRDGRVHGHLAKWGSRHIGFADRAVHVPRSRTNYAHFRTGKVLTAEGTLVATGPIYLDGGHAPMGLGAQEAKDWMAETSAAVADVAVYEDEWGIQAVGALRPGITEEQVRALRASDVSPDWRRIDGNLEMVGAVAVNVSGFIVPGLVASGAAVRWDNEHDEPVALVATGIVHRDPTLVLARRVAELENFVQSLRAERVARRFEGVVPPFSGGDRGVGAFREYVRDSLGRFAPVYKSNGGIDEEGDGSDESVEAFDAVAAGDVDSAIIDVGLDTGNTLVEDRVELTNDGRHGVAVTHTGGRDWSEYEYGPPEGMPEEPPFESFEPTPLGSIQSSGGGFYATDPLGTPIQHSYVPGTFAFASPGEAILSMMEQAGIGAMFGEGAGGGDYAARRAAFRAVRPPFSVPA